MQKWYSMCIINEVIVSSLVFVEFLYGNGCGARTFIRRTQTEKN